MGSVKRVKVRDLYIGGGSPVSVQSMTNTKTTDVLGTLAQIEELKRAGCDIVRLAVMNDDACNAFGKIREKTDMPLVADIHFDYRLAIKSALMGADKIRINPGNIGDEDKIKEVVKAVKQKGIPIRIGVNGGSLEKDLLAKYGSPTAEAMYESGKRHIQILNKFDFDDIVISLKSSNVLKTVEAYKMFAEREDYPLHLGVTEAGTLTTGVVKSSICFYELLKNNIGDTIRVSLTANPVQEAIAGVEILRAMGLRDKGAKLISCPTCSRCNIDLITLAGKVQDMLFDVDKNITVAVMGCVVNGPGEAREADIGICGGVGEGLIIKGDKIIKKVPEDMLLDELKKEIDKL